MNTQNTGVLTLIFSYIGDGFVDILNARRHCRGHIRRCPRIEMVSAYSVDRVFRRLHAVLAPTSVGMYIYISGNAKSAACVDDLTLLSIGYLSYHSVFNYYVASLKLAASIYPCIF